MPHVLLAQLEDVLENKFGPYVLEGLPGGDVTLVAALRLGEKKLTQLQALQVAPANEEIKQSIDRMKAMIRLVAKTPADAKRLLDWVGDDVAKLRVVLEDYGKGTQLGEASSSPA